MQLSTFQRRQLRRIVGISDRLYDTRLGMSDRRRETNADLLEARNQAQLIEQAISREYLRPDVQTKLRSDLSAWRERITELEQAVADLDHEFDQIGPVADAAGRLADRLLNHAGVARRDFDPAITQGGLSPQIIGRGRS